MRLCLDSVIRPCLVITTTLCLAMAGSPGLNLSGFQQITGFSASCTAAYNTAIPGCTTEDFAGNNPCSVACISGLQYITALLNSACQGTQANPSTLIGMFFEGTGVTALCPNAGSDTASQSTFSGTGGSMSTTIPSMTLSSSSSSVISSIDTSSTSAPSFGIRTTPTSSMTPTMLTTSSLLFSSASTATNVVASLSTSSPPGSGFTKTVVNDGSAVVLTSKPEQTTSTNPDAFGGGGSPFEISRGAHLSVHLSCILIGFCAGMFLFYWG